MKQPAAVHMVDAGRLHGIRCNRYHRRRRPLTTSELAAVTCSSCRGLAATPSRV